jgi:hypothetical protein
MSLGRARGWGQVRSRALLALAVVLAGACTDGTLDLTRREPLTGQAGMAGVSGTSGTSGTGGTGGDGGSSGDEGLAGAAGADAGESALFAPDFCQGGVGECLFRDGELACTGEVGETAVTVRDGVKARLRIDMTNAVELKLAFEICDPSGYVLNIGDSPSDNGGGGDAGHFEHDAEVMIYDADLTAWSSDLGYEQTTPTTGYHPLLLSEPGYISEHGCSVRTLRLRDQYIDDADDPRIRTQSPVALRINPRTDEQGVPDARWYVGVNRVISDSVWDATRVGSGAQALRLCFHVPPPLEPPRTGP